MKEHLITQIEKYTPFNRQEELDKTTILYFLRNFTFAKIAAPAKRIAPTKVAKMVFCSPVLGSFLLL